MYIQPNIEAGGFVANGPYSSCLATNHRLVQLWVCAGAVLVPLQSPLRAAPDNMCVGAGERCAAVAWMLRGFENHGGSEGFAAELELVAAVSSRRARAGVKTADGKQAVRVLPASSTFSSYDFSRGYWAEVPSWALLPCTVGRQRQQCRWRLYSCRNLRGVNEGRCRPAWRLKAEKPPLLSSLN